VRDDYGKGYLKVWEIAKKSNNIGTYMLAKQVGYRKYMDYVKTFGFGHNTGIGIGAESDGLVRDNGNMVDFSRCSFGYSLRVTPLQIANFYCAIANGGNLMKPRVIKKVEDYRGVTVEEYKPEIIRRVLSEKTAKDCREVLRTVVEKGGTATRADVEGFTEGGKTGTAEIWDNKLKAYSDTRKTVSFVGMLPIEAPKFVCVVVIEEPRTEKDYNFGGGTVAAPIWRETMKQITAYRNLKPTEEVKSTLSNAL
jgi:cell division protein FtsI/penicillin-binding protein 2